MGVLLLPVSPVPAPTPSLLLTLKHPGDNTILVHMPTLKVNWGLGFLINILGWVTFLFIKKKFYWFLPRWWCQPVKMIKYYLSVTIQTSSLEYVIHLKESTHRLCNLSMKRFHKLIVVNQKVNNFELLMIRCRFVTYSNLIFHF